MTSSQHLSDEAVAAFADGVLRGHARERAARHTASCTECANAVAVQREAAWALRAASAPELPVGLAARLRTLPQTTPLNLPPIVAGPDGTSMFATFTPMAAFVPPQRPDTRRSRHRLNPMVTTAAVVALTGVLSVGAAVAQPDGSVADPGAAQVTQQFTPAPGVADQVIAPVSVFRALGR